MSESPYAKSTPPQSGPRIGRILAIVMPVAALGLAAYLYAKTLESKALVDAAPSIMSRMFTAEPLSTGKMEFPDTNGDLVADAPSDPAKCITPDVLVFSYVASEEAGPPEDSWKELAAALKEKTGKELKIVHFKTPDEQLEALKKGELHIVGVNTGLVERAVEEDGFVPFCTMGKKDGAFGYTMEFIVPAGSPIKKPEDIKGHKVMFTRLDSNSGCKAPLVELKDKFNLLPERDYRFGFSQGHEDSIKKIAEKEKDFDVAPVASDILARMKENKDVDGAAVVTIYTSERFPPATIGYAYNLTPELRDGIRDVLLKFDWVGTGLEKQFGPEGKEKFVAVSYKDDWANTRRIDQVIAGARKQEAPSKSGS